MRVLRRLLEEAGVGRSVRLVGAEALTLANPEGPDAHCDGPPSPRSLGCTRTNRRLDRPLEVVALVVLMPPSAQRAHKDRNQEIEDRKLVARDVIRLLLKSSPNPSSERQERVHADPAEGNWDKAP
jgi:hypothetical protein